MAAPSQQPSGPWVKYQNSTTQQTEPSQQPSGQESTHSEQESTPSGPWVKYQKPPMNAPSQNVQTEDEARSYAAKGARLGGQFALGVAQGSPLGMAYDISTAAQGYTGANLPHYRQEIAKDLANLQVKKSIQGWSDNDQELYSHLESQLKNTNQSLENLPKDISIRSLSEAATGIDLHAKDISEKAANFLGLISNPVNVANLARAGSTTKDIFKAMVPSAINLTRAASVGTGLQLAEEGKLGPLGTLAVAVGSDVIAHAPRSAYRAALNPKQTAANLLNTITRNNSKQAIREDLIKASKDMNINLDAATLSQSPMIQYAQTKLAQSGLTGEPLRVAREELAGQIVREYEAITNDLSQVKYDNWADASDATNNAIEKANNILKGEITDLSNIKPNLQPSSKGTSTAREIESLQPTGENYPLKGRIETEAKPNFNTEELVAPELPAPIPKLEKPERLPTTEKPNIKTAKQLAQRDMLNAISPTEIPSERLGGEELKNAALEIQKPIKQEFKDRYQSFDNAIEQLPESPQPDLAKTINEFIENNQGSLLYGASTAESQVIRNAENLLSKLETEGAYNGVSLKELTKTKTTLQDISAITFSTPGFKKRYGELIKAIDKSIENTLEQQSPTLLSEWTQLSADYTNYKRLFGNKEVWPLFDRTNERYSSIYHSFASNPDDLKALEAIFQGTKHEKLLNEVKRSFASNKTSGGNLTQGELRNLASNLGENHNGAIYNYAQEQRGSAKKFEAYQEAESLRKLRQRNSDIAHQKLEFERAQANEKAIRTFRKETESYKAEESLRKGRVAEEKAYIPKAAKKEGLPVSPQALPSVSAKQRVGVQKTLNYLESSSPEQLKKSLSSVQGIRELKKELSYSQEGKELFESLARTKLGDIIDNRLSQSLKSQAREGKFAKLIEPKDRALIKELVGDANFERLSKLDALSDTIWESQLKFDDPYLHKIVSTDTLIAAKAITSIFTMNPWLATSALGIAGTRSLVTRLLSDKEFLKAYEQAILSKSSKSFAESLKKLDPIVLRASANND